MSWLYSLVFAGILFSSGTDSVRVSNISGQNDGSIVGNTLQDETERIEKSFPLNANGRVSVSNVNGSITVTAWDRSEVRLVAVKTADTKEHLADVDIKIDSKPDYFRVESDYGEWNRNSKSDNGRWRNNGKLTVDYELTVPRGAMLDEIETVNGTAAVSDFTNFTKVSAVNGSVRASNLRGAANLSTVNGEVEADFERLDAGSKISLNTVNGHVNVTIPSDSNTTLKAESLNGAITNDFGLPVRKGSYVGRDLYGRLGSGEASIKLESVNGGLSVKRRNDGRPLSPATNLLPPKGADDDDGDIDTNKDSETADTVRINRKITRSITQAQREAMIDAQREIVKIKPKIGKINADAMREAAKAIDSEVQTQGRSSMEQQRVLLASLRDANFLMGVPRVVSKSDSINVKGTPKITIDAKGCAVRVRGWDKQEVQYSITQLSNGTAAAPVHVSENHSDSVVNITISNNDKALENGALLFDSSHILIEILVPRKSNLKIVSSGEIRLEGVSGDLEVTGGDEPVNIRDAQGRLTVWNDDGRVRVIGFDGDVNARTADGNIYLEGRFDKLTGKADTGTITITLPEGSNAEFSANSEIESDGFDLTKQGNHIWKLGSGGPKFSFDLADGKLIVRSSSVIGRD